MRAFHAKLEVSLDRPHAKCVLKSSGEEVSFHEKNEIELLGQSSGQRHCGKEKPAKYPHQTPGPRETKKQTRHQKPQQRPAARPKKNRAAETPVHSVACSVGTGGVTYVQRNAYN